MNRSHLSRRNLLKVAGSAAVPILLPGGLGPGESECRAADVPNDSCTLGFSTYGMKEMASQRAIRLLDEIGYDAVELAVRSGWDADSAVLGKGRRVELRRMIDQSGLRLTSLMEHVYPTDDEQQAIALERLKMAADVAHDLVPEDPPLVQTVLGGGDFENDKNMLRDRLGEWIRLADSTDTTIAIKPHRGGAVSKPSHGVWLIEQLGDPARLRMVYDYSHYAFRDLSLDETIRTALPFTAHVAVKDAVDEGKRIVFRLPGTAGTIDFASLIRQFHNGGYRGDFNCEVSGMVWNKKGYDPVAAARRCYETMSRAFADSGVRRPVAA